jgi:hypothetical protein
MKFIITVDIGAYSLRHIGGWRIAIDLYAIDTLLIYWNTLCSLFNFLYERLVVAPLTRIQSFKHYYQKKPAPVTVSHPRHVYCFPMAFATDAAARSFGTCPEVTARPLSERHIASKSGTRDEMDAAITCGAVKRARAAAGAVASRVRNSEAICAKRTAEASG